VPDFITKSNRTMSDFKLFAAAIKDRYNPTIQQAFADTCKTKQSYESFTGFFDIDTGYSLLNGLFWGYQYSADCNVTFGGYMMSSLWMLVNAHVNGIVYAGCVFINKPISIFDNLDEFKDYSGSTTENLEVPAYNI